MSLKVPPVPYPQDIREIIGDDVCVGSMQIYILEGEAERAALHAAELEHQRVEEEKRKDIFRWIFVRDEPPAEDPNEPAGAKAERLRRIRLRRWFRTAGRARVYVYRSVTMCEHPFYYFTPMSTRALVMDVSNVDFFEEEGVVPEALEGEIQDFSRYHWTHTKREYEAEIQRLKEEAEAERLRRQMEEEEEEEDEAEEIEPIEKVGITVVQIPIKNSVTGAVKFRKQKRDVYCESKRWRRLQRQKSRTQPSSGRKSRPGSALRPQFLSEFEDESHMYFTLVGLQGDRREVGRTRVHFLLPDGSEPDVDIDNTPTTRTASDEEEPPDPMEAFRVGEILTPGLVVTTLPTSTRTPSEGSTAENAGEERAEMTMTIVEASRRAVFCCPDIFEGEPFYYTKSMNPILVMDPSKIEYLPGKAPKTEAELAELELRRRHRAKAKRQEKTDTERRERERRRVLRRDRTIRKIGTMRITYPPSTSSASGVFHVPLGEVVRRRRNVFWCGTGPVPTVETPWDAEARVSAAEAAVEAKEAKKAARLADYEGIPRKYIPNSSSSSASSSSSSGGISISLAAATVCEPSLLECEVAPAKDGALLLVGTTKTDDLFWRRAVAEPEPFYFSPVGNKVYIEDIGAITFLYTDGTEPPDEDDILRAAEAGEDGDVYEEEPEPEPEEEEEEEEEEPEPTPRTPTPLPEPDVEVGTILVVVPGPPAATSADGAYYFDNGKPQRESVKVLCRPEDLEAAEVLKGIILKNRYQYAALVKAERQAREERRRIRETRRAARIQEWLDSGLKLETYEDEEEDKPQPEEEEPKKIFFFYALGTGNKVIVEDLALIRFKGRKAPPAEQLELPSGCGGVKGLDSFKENGEE